MSKTTLLFILLLKIPFLVIHSQNYYIKAVTITSSSSDSGLDIIANEEGYTIRTGSIFFSVGVAGIGIIRTSFDGDKIWENSVNFSPYESGSNNIIRLDNGNYIIAGGRIEEGLSFQYLYTVINSSGDLVRNATHGNELDNRTPFIMENGNKVISFTSFGVTNMYKRNLLVAMDTTCMEILRMDTIPDVEGYTYNGSEEIILLPTQEYILGIGAQNEPNKIYGYLRKTDTIGTTIWEQKLSEATPPIPLIHLANMQNGNFVVSWMDLLGGDTENKASYFVRCYNPDGDIIWQYTFEAIGYGRNIQDLHVCANGDIIGCGYTGNFDITGNPTSWIFRLSPQGELLWMREYVYWEALNKYMPLYAIAEDPNGDIIATGFAAVPVETGGWKGQAVLLKVNSMGCFDEGGCNDTAIVHSVVTGIEAPDNGGTGSVASFSPVKVAWLGYGEMAVFYNLPAYPPASLHLYDIQGRHIATQPLPPYDIFTPLQTPPLPPGIYLYTAEQGGMVVARGKVAVVR